MSQSLKEYSDNQLKLIARLRFEIKELKDLNYELQLELKQLKELK